ncbi:hypothetical protein CLU79DRAFT_763028 [Phycomyces nitens]|nr:hypothetical protein CLU79DRAFT_763028 [Phycomyces nitens]
MPTDLNNQTIQLPDTKTPGQTAIYRNSGFPELTEAVKPEIKTTYDIFANGLSISRNMPCLGHRPLINAQTCEYGPYVWETYQEVSDRIDNFGSGLVDLFENTLDIRTDKSLPVGIWSVNRPEWNITDIACSAYSFFIVALYDSLGPDAVRYVINHSELQVVVCSITYIKKLLEMSESVPNIKAIVSIDPLDGSASDPSIVVADIIDLAAKKNIHLVDFKTVEANGAAKKQPHRIPKPNDVTCIMYTSGTTGSPKGAMITHDNCVVSVSAICLRYCPKKTDISMSYLPLAHIFARLVDWMMLQAGGQIGFYQGSMALLMPDIQLLKPTFFIIVPRLMNRVYAGIAQATILAPGIKGVIARRAVAAKLERLANNGGVTHAFWDPIVFNKAKNVLGGRVHTMVTGAAPIAADILQFMRIVLGCSLVEGYGSTETTAAATGQDLTEYTAGHVGAPFPGNEMKLVDIPEMNYLSTDKPFPRGEVCMRGRNVFAGYYKDEENTREALDSEGWYHTGDVGVINEQGCLRLIDRKKNIFKLAQGEYIAPEKIENIYVKNPLVSQIFIHGDSLQYSLVAIVVPDKAALNKLAQTILPGTDLDYQAQCDNFAIREAVLGQLTQSAKKGGLLGFEIARAIYLETNQFSTDNDILTPSFKLKRHQAKLYYEKHIEKLYADMEAKNEKLAASRT